MDTAFTAWAWPWWTVLVVINAFNLLIAVIIFRRSVSSKEITNAGYRKKMRILGLIYVCVAAYRSVFVSSYLGQLAWFDSIANSSLLIRFFAIFAELSFAGLFMLAMLQINKDLPAPQNNKTNRFLSFIQTKPPYVFFACLFIAQFFATTALITKNELFFAIEESLWGAAFLSILPLSIIQVRRVYSVKDEAMVKELKMLRIFTVINLLWCSIYCCYSLFYHLPIEYWPHVISELQSGNLVLKSGLSAVRDAFLIVNETKDFQTWGGLGFVIWHSGYFSVCVWIVLFIMNGPRKQRY